MKHLLRMANTAYVVSLGAKSAGLLAGALVLLLLAGWLTYVLLDDGLFLLIPAFIGGKGISLVIRGLEPFASQQSKSDPATSWLEQRRNARHRPQRQAPAEPSRQHRARYRA